MKFQAINANRIVLGVILDEKVIEMRWIKGDIWCQFLAPPGTSWKELCRRARIAKSEFKTHLKKQGQVNGKN